jgi:thiol:disulfide interchange protein DsbD
MRLPTLHLALRFALIAAIAIPGACGAAAVRTPHVEAELVADRAAMVPGQPLTVALRLVMDRGWHTYWQNPGDSGLPTTLVWKLPERVTAGPIQWPSPRIINVGPLANYGYEGEVLLPSEIHVPSEFGAGKPITLSARADWLVCKEICVPEGADLLLTLPAVADAALAMPDPRWGDAIARTRSALPRPLQGWDVAARGRGEIVDLVLTPKPGSPQADVSALRFFPFVEGQIEASGRQTLVRDGSTLTLSLPVASQRVGAFDRVAGVLTASPEIGGMPAAIVDAPLTGSVTAATGPAPRLASAGGALAQASALSLGVAIGFAFLGGILLNLMPCVFPVLSLKVLGFARHHESRASMRRHGIAFAAGVIVSFWLLAAALVALRAAGEQLGWGFQLQSPAVIAALALLFFILALNLSGVFEVRQLVPSGMATWNAKNPVVNDVLSGALAVLIASPCSAPFMGAALGYALTEASVSTWLIFTALGAGMALPYLALAFFPRWREKLPKPGMWMVRLKQFLAFPLYATVLWLLWVLGAQLDNDAVARLGMALLLVGFALWAWQAMRTGGRRTWGIAAVAGVAGALVVAWPVAVVSTSEEMPLAAKGNAGESAWQEFSTDRVSRLVGAGRTVFVDFTAAWCVTCQVNKRLVLNSDAVRGAFASRNVALVRADWTRRDPSIGAALAALGRDGVPVYVLFSPGKEPRLLPEVLRRQDILEALSVVQNEAAPSVASK